MREEHQEQLELMANEETMALPEHQETMVEVTEERRERQETWERGADQAQMELDLKVQLTCVLIPVP